MTGGYLLDTSVVLTMAQGTGVAHELQRFPPAPTAISIVTEAELRAGLNTVSGQVRLARMAVLERLLVMYEPLPFDRAVAQAYGRVHLAVVEAGRKPRGRLADLVIAATAVAHDLTLVTADVDDVAGLEPLVRVLRLPLADPSPDDRPGSR